MSKIIEKIYIFVVLTILSVFSLIDTVHLTAEAHGENPELKDTELKSSAPAGVSRGGTVMSKEEELTIFDFSKKNDLDQWWPINDTVMGGISESQLQQTKEGNALFAGNVSLENYGGFASLQSQPSHYNFTGYEGIAIRLKGDGKRYKLSLKNNTFLDAARYEAAFNTEKEIWTTIPIPFTTLVPTFRGIVLTNETPLAISRVKSFGLLISDKQKGPFRIEIAWIKAY